MNLRYELITQLQVGEHTLNPVSVVLVDNQLRDDQFLKLTNVYSTLHLNAPYRKRLVELVDDALHIFSGLPEEDYDEATLKDEELTFIFYRRKLEELPESIMARLTTTFWRVIKGKR